MPHPAILSIPAAAVAVKAARAAHVAAHAASSCAQYNFLVMRSILATILGRKAWRRLPKWVRNDPSFRSISGIFNNRGDYDEMTVITNDEEAEMSSLASVLRKIESYASDLAAAAAVSSFSMQNEEMMGKINNKKENEGPITALELHAAFWAFVQLLKQHRLLNPKARDDMYSIDMSYSAHDESCSGPWTWPSSSLSQTKLKELRFYLDFAIWSYIDYYGPERLSSQLASRSYDLLSFHLADTPGRASYFIAVSDLEEILLIGVKGTSTFEDLLTDAAGAAVIYNVQNEGCESEGVEVTTGAVDTSKRALHQPPTSVSGSEAIELLWNDGNISSPKYALHNPNDNGDNRKDDSTQHCRDSFFSEMDTIAVHEDGHGDIKGTTSCCHEGIHLSARRLADSLHPTIQRFAVRKGYSIRICGHSLGGGIAALLAILLRSRYTSLAELDLKDICSNNKDIKNDCGSNGRVLQRSDPIRAYAFAPPPILDIDGSTGCAPYVTSIVYNADIIPRASISNFSVCLEILKEITFRLRKCGMGLKSPKSAARLLRKLSRGIKSASSSTKKDNKKGLVDDKEIIPLMTWQELRRTIDRAHHVVDVRDPVHLFVPGKVVLLYEPWQKAANVANKNEIQDDNQNFTCDHVQISRARSSVTYGSAAPLRMLEVGDLTGMVTDHLAMSYVAAIDSLLEHSHDKE